ncbi:MAG: LacI family DNA-binding transcriptional regulator [Spirochaetota bacterium]
MVTIKEVAARAGVSTATVSRVLNRRGRYTPDTEQRVLAAVKELGYAVNPTARSLKTGTSATMGILLPPAVLLDHPDILHTALGYLFGRGYAVHILPDGEMEEGITGLGSGRFDGLLCMMTPVSQQALGGLLETGKGFVLMGVETERQDVNLVDIDYFQAGYTATAELIGLGHRDILFVSGLGDRYRGRELLRGYLLALDENGIRYREELLVNREVPAATGGAALGHEAVRQRWEAGLSAVFAADDRIAAGALRWAADNGLRVPGELSVVGVGDLPLSAYLHIPLTTVKLPFVQFGELGAEILVNAVQRSDGLVTRVKLNSRLVPRTTWARAPGGRAAW